MTEVRPNAESKQVSSPVATGGGGHVFEQHVNTVFLSLLLVKGIPPVISDCLLSEVHFQTEHLGWQTDDVLLRGLRADGGKRTMALQVKRTFTLSSSNDECIKTFRDFWQDFHNQKLFEPTRDCLALVVQQGTSILLRGFGGLLDCARASKDACDFAQRLATPGMLSGKSKVYAGQIRTIVQQVAEVTFSEEALWAFLRSLHLLSFDIVTSTNQTEAWIRTLLAHTATPPDKQSAAISTWNELLAFASNMMPQAASITITSLPESSRNRHSPIADTSIVAFNRLRAHSQTVLRGIRMTLAGTVQLPRDNAVAEILQRLDEARVVLVAGPAGFGKSFLARRANEQLAADSIVFAFRAEEFATSHLDEVLHRAQIGAGSEELFSLLAGQSRKVIQVESIERLLESTQREAFLDLLRLVADDPNWRLILTCRDYSIETVRAAFLEHVGLLCDVFTVPELSDEELTQVVQVIPSLSRPTEQAFLNKLFRNPYYLDKAASMSWPQEATLPANERAFRDKFWREVVRHDAHAGNDMPRRRAQAFIHLCVRRAKALEPFVRCDNLDSEALNKLHTDGLIIYAAATEAMAAPAHDALEDWGVIRWIDETYEIHNKVPVEFASELGSYPAIRRAYRKWMADFLDAHPDKSDAFVTGIVKETALPLHFRDDTLVAALLSPVAADFLERIKPILLQNDGKLLRHVIHLLRVACKTTPPWVRPVGQGRAIWLIPHGSAWPAVLHLVSESFDELPSESRGLLAGLLTDWAAGVSFVSPHPDGMHDAAQIAYRLLPHLDHYSRDGLLVDVLKVIVKIPKGDEQAFADLATRASAINRSDRTDHVASEFAKILLTGMDGWHVCRDMPDAVTALAFAYFRGGNEDCRHYHALALEYIFGLSENLHFDFSEPSAWRGPFLPLLRCHLAKGINFVLDLLNHACETFSQRHQFVQYIAGPGQITIGFSDGTERSQWYEERLWNLYRGTSVGPHVLQCALMALESRLLELGEYHPQHLDGWLVHLLRESNNVAITAVVASVALAYPKAAGEAALAILSSRDLVLLDKRRLLQDNHPPSLLLDYFPLRGGESALYGEERRESDQLAHRQRDLEWLSIVLATGPLHQRIYALIDAHRSALPAVDEQNETDKVWRLALHRMDFRRYQVVQDAAATNSVGAESMSETVTEHTPTSRQLMVMSTGLEPDLEAFVDKDAPVRDRFSEGTALFMWAMSCWRGETADKYKPKEWRAFLERAIELTQGDRSLIDSDILLRNVPGLIAAVCVRDHWSELDEDKQRWLIGELVFAIARDAERSGRDIRMSTNLSDASRPAAYVISAVLRSELPLDLREKAYQAIADALVHPCREVGSHAAEGIGAHLVSHDPPFVLRSVRALAVRAKWIQELWQAQDQIDYVDRVRPEQLERDIRPRTLEAILTGMPCTQDDLLALDLNDWWGRESMSHILAILSHWPDLSLTSEAYRLVAEAFARWWSADRRGASRRMDRDYQMEDEYLRRLSEFCIHLRPAGAVAMCDPLLSAVEHHPDDVEWFIKRLIFAVDKCDDVGSFWDVWHALSKRITTAPWLDNLDTRSRDHSKLLSAIFLDIEWKKGVKDWRHLDGYSHLLEELFASLPPKPTVFRCFLAFLDQIGECSLPQSFVLLSQKLGAGDTHHILSDQSVVFHMENILRRHIYSKPTELKAKDHLRSSILHLLDELVLAGSSAAYRMRDDFVTPGTGTRVTASSDR